MFFINSIVIYLKMETSNAIKQRIDTLNEHFTNNEIDLICNYSTVYH